MAPVGTLESGSALRQAQGRPASIWRWLALGAALLIATVVAGCADSSSEAPPTGIQAVVISSDLAVGQNRFVLGLLTQDNQVITDAHVHFDFFRQGDDSIPVNGIEAVFKSTKVEFTHVHESGEQHLHEEVTGVYVANVTFAQPETLYVRVTGTLAEGEPLTARTADFAVQPQSQTPAVGSPVPRSSNPTTADVSDITLIDSSDPPRPEMHALSIAQAIDTGKPVVIAFATPAFCQSRICGPTMEVMDELYSKYGDAVAFVHVEPYDLAMLRQQGQFQLSPAAVEWRLPTEPWVFVVDRQGRLAAKFEGIVTVEDVEMALAGL
jgi:hypothetical protein